MYKNKTLKFDKTMSYMTSIVSNRNARSTKALLHYSVNRLTVKFLEKNPKNIIRTENP